MSIVFSTMKRKNLGSLSFLQDYNSDESDEGAEICKQKKRLPTPNLPVYSECKSIARPPKSSKSDITKIRNFAHEPGNWATYIYVPVDKTDEILEFVNDLCVFFPNMELNVAEDFHISVTRTVILRHHWIKDFTHSVNEILVETNPFFINLSGLKIYVNENKTRTFVALKVDEGAKDLYDIVQLTDKCLQNYNLPTFYKPASFHASILWCVGDKTRELNQHFKSLPENFQEFNICFKVSHLKCACGNKTFTFNFT